MADPVLAASRTFARVLIAVATLCIGLALMEAALWARLPQRRLPFDGIRDGTRYTWGQPVRTNRLGFRERDFATPKPAGVYRVMVVGDSLTWGVGLAPHERYTERAQALLRQRFPQHDVEVLNFGVPGASMAAYRDTLQQLASVVEPDLIVIGYCLNDPQPRDQGFSVERQRLETRLKPLLSALAAYGWLAPNTARRAREALWHALEASGRVPRWPDGLDRVYDPRSPAWDEFNASLRAVAQLAADRHLRAPILLVLNQGSSTEQPTFYSHPDPMLQRMLGWYRQAADAGRAAGFLTVDVAAELAAQLDGHVLAINVIDAHPSAEQHRIYADKLAATVADVITTYPP
jgi:nucleotide-binding universal stress UspA family protein